MQILNIKICQLFSRVRVRFRNSIQFFVARARYSRQLHPDCINEAKKNIDKVEVVDEFNRC